MHQHLLSADPPPAAPLPRHAKVSENLERAEALASRGDPHVAQVLQAQVRAARQATKDVQGRLEQRIRQLEARLAAVEVSGKGAGSAEVAEREERGGGAGGQKGKARA